MDVLIADTLKKGHRFPCYTLNITVPGDTYRYIGSL